MDVGLFAACSWSELNSAYVSCVVPLARPRTKVHELEAEYAETFLGLASAGALDSKPELNRLENAYANKEVIPTTRGHE